MPGKTHRNFLRQVLWADAISCLSCGLLQVTLTDPLSSDFGLPQALLSSTGAFLLLYGAAVALLATRTRALNVIVRLLILGNIAWGVLAVGILFEGNGRITLLGKGYILAQALIVLILAQLQFFWVRANNAERLA